MNPSHPRADSRSLPKTNGTQSTRPPRPSVPISSHQPPYASQPFFAAFAGRGAPQAGRKRKNPTTTAGPATKRQRNENVPPTTEPAVSTAPSRVAPSAFGPAPSQDTDTETDEDDESPTHRALAELSATSDARPSGSGKTQSANNAWYFIAGSDYNTREDNDPPETEEDQLRRLGDPKRASMNSVECPEFRDLLLFLSAELEDEDIPHRTLLTELIAERFKIEKARMEEDLQSAAGRVSYTADVWSRANMQPFLAVTAHYIVRTEKGRLEERHRLVAFRHLPGTHDGRHLAEVFLAILDELDMLKRIGAITLDNASNNNTMMEWLEKLLKDRHIYFDRDGNRIRCFPHVINIAVKTGVKYMTKDRNTEAEATEEQVHEDVPEVSVYSDLEYAQILDNDPIGKARTLSNWFRLSDQRRSALKTAILRGNAALREQRERAAARPSNPTSPSANTSPWLPLSTAPAPQAGQAGDEAAPPAADSAATDEVPLFNELLAVVTLLRDVDTRWSSVYLMILRLLELYPAAKYVLCDPKHAKDRHHLLQPKELKVLKDISIFLSLFHKTQELLSANRTPTLAYAIPAYELLLQGLEALKRGLPGLRHAIVASQRKLIEYLSLCRRSRLYALAMATVKALRLMAGINPNMKFEWARTHWPHEDYETARRHFRDAMLEQKRAMRRESAATSARPHRSRAAAVGVSAAARSQGAGFSGLESFVSSLTSICSQDDVQSSTEVEDDDVPQRQSPQSDNADEEDSEAAADARDEAEVDSELNGWESKGIIRDENQRANLDLVRSWEMLKYMFREDRLDMTEGLLAREEELEALDIDPSLYDELLTGGRYKELVDLLDSHVYMHD
ncbi:ribonuclease H-like domain-containing protein [Schizophyllum fasciatum]